MFAADNSPNLAAIVGKASGLTAFGEGVPAYHVHYEIRMVDRSGRASTATFDRVQLELKHSRVEESAADYHKIVIGEGEKMWISRTGEVPLRLMEFDWAWPRFRQAIDALMRGGRLLPVRSLQASGRELQCAGDTEQAQVCVDSSSGLYFSAGKEGTLVTYDKWVPVGQRFLPTSIVLSRGKKILLEAKGTVEAPAAEKTQDQFQPPAGAIEIDTTQRDEHGVPLGQDQDRYRIVHREPVRISARGVYGNVLVQVQVDARGRVRKADVLDSDDRALESPALDAARATVYAPYEVSGQYAPFETTIFYGFSR